MLSAKTAVWVRCVIAFALAPIAVAGRAETPAAAPPRERSAFDAGWRFAFGHPFDRAKDFDHDTGYFSDEAKAGYGDGPAAAGFDDRAWRQLDLPHDWAAEAPFSPDASSSHGFKAIGRNFPDRAIGWYRKTFAVPASDLGRRIAVEFDGVFRDCVVWVNGFRLGRHASGYSGFRYDLTDYLNYGADNVITVRVDASKEEGWFYEGAGIYRHVWLAKTGPVHVAPEGTFVTTRVDELGRATVAIETTVENDGGSSEEVGVALEILGQDGRSVAFGEAGNVAVDAGTTKTAAAAIAIEHPQLWSPDSPTLYRVVTTIRKGGVVLDRQENSFGVRTVRFDPDHGFFLNGKRVELQGVNLHQDFAGVGVAVPDALQRYRLTRLKDFGVNAVRCAHNPPAPEFLDTCDRLGLLVIDENRLMGSSPAQLDELASMVRRDRNHPSVILWSIGNEEWAIEGNSKGARIATTMQAAVRRLDPTRRITAANSGGWGGISTVIDVVGYNYIHQSNPDQQHKDFPRQPGVGTEETTTQGTRGIYFDDRDHVHLSRQAHGDSGGNCEQGWTYYAARSFLAGLFYWTGFDYRGEPTPFGWPAVSSQFGLLDTCGFRKDSTYYLESWWTEHPVLHLATHWNWPGREGQGIKVVVYSNCDTVELRLNGTSLGTKPMVRNSHLEWMVPYAPGTLEARGYRAGKLAETTRVETTGPAVRLDLTSSRRAVAADGRDAVVVSVCARDAQGRVVPDAANFVHFDVTGGRTLGVGNGDPGCHEPDQFPGTNALVAIEDWRGRIVAAGTPFADNPASLEPLPRLGNWLAPKPKDGEEYELTGTFAFGGAASGDAVTLYLPSLGARTSVWLNGHQLATDVDTSAHGPAVSLQPADLVKGDNRVQLRVTPFQDHRNHIPELTRVGTVSIATPAPAAGRSLFSGLAALIVGAPAAPGTIRIRATADGLAPASVTIDATR